MENIASKIKALNCPEDQITVLSKFLVSLSDEVVLLEEEVRILNYLNEKGISIRPSQIKIFGYGFSYVHDTVEEMEALGEIQAYVEDASRICSKEAIKRLKWLKKNGYEYKSPEGKYAKTVFSKKAFVKQYGFVDLDEKKENVKEEDAQSVSFQETKTTQVLSDSQSINPADVKPLLEEVKAEEIVVHESQEPVDLIAIKTELDAQEKTNEPAKDKGSVIDFTGAEVTDDFGSPYEEILAKPQTIGLNDETFDKYEKLVENTRHVLVSVYNIAEVSDTVTDNLIKLITSGVTDEADIIFYAITYGAGIESEEEIQRLKNAIKEELEYTSILDLDIGRVA